MSTDQNILSGYITRPKLAKQLRRSERTLARWEDLRIGPPVTRVGCEPYYNAESIRAWLKSCEQKMPRAYIRNVRAATRA
jgi:hypothetical protein